MWSLLCEEIYYFIYPLLLYLRQRFGWVVIITPLMVLSVALSATQPKAESFHDFVLFRKPPRSFTPFGFWGAFLRRKLTDSRHSNPEEEFLVGGYLHGLVVGVVCILHFHSLIAYMQTCMWFGVLAYFWVRNEIAYGKSDTPAPLDGLGGAWSYSLYFCCTDQPSRRCGVHNLPFLGPLMNWVITMIFVCVYSYVFYLLVERPSHQLARKILSAWKDYNSP